MLASLVVSMIAALAQPAGAPAPLVAQLCNETPARVAFSVTYPAGVTAQRRRGWLTVAPGDCSGGSIGQTTGGTAQVYAMSGTFSWPAPGAGALRCVPASSHDGVGSSPPCAAGEREFDTEAYGLEDRRNHYTLNVTVTCADLPESERDFCASGRTDAQGFAERVRTFEVCNLDRSATAIAVAAEATGGQTRVEGWIGLEPGQCQVVWRGFSSDRVVYAHTSGLGMQSGGADYRPFCVEPMQGFSRAASAADGEAACPEGLEMRSFRPVRFGPNVSQMTLDIERL